MQAALPEFDFACARNPEVDRVCRAVLLECTTAVAGNSAIEALLLTGSLAKGAACGAVRDGEARVLSDVDLVVVPRRGETAGLRREVVRLSEELSGMGKRLGLISHVEYGVLARRHLVAPRDTLFLHDLARTGRLLSGSEGPLRRLAARLAGRVVLPVEGRVLVDNRIAGQLFMLGWLGSEVEEDRWVARYQFAKAYADNRIALRVGLGVESHPILEKQERAAHRWSRFRDDPAASEAVSREELLVEWKATVADQLEVAGKLDVPGCNDGARLRAVLAWRRHPEPCPSLGHRLGLRGSPLDRAHGMCRDVARRIIEAKEPATELAAKAGEAARAWRLSLIGVDDVETDYPSKVARLLEKG